jgi:hypothetical protein
MNGKINPELSITMIHSLCDTYLLNNRKVEPGQITRTPQPAGKILSGFDLAEHELIEINPPSSMMNIGENTLAFYIDRFPKARDPYVYIYELIVDVIPNTAQK